MDAKTEIEKLGKKVAALQLSQQSLQKVARSKDYETKVPEKVRAANAEKLVKLRIEIAAADKGIAEFEKLA